MRKDGRTDRKKYGEDNSRFLKFCEGAYKGNHISSGDEMQFVAL